MQEVLRLEGLTKRFGNGTAVDRLSLTIYEGESFALLGPSGCGKTTTLRMIAGLEQPDQGRILCRDQTFVSVAEKAFMQPERRRVGMVFQSLALWPHMSVFENVAYPLRIRRLTAITVREKVTAMLRVVGLEDMGARQVPTLSGGEQQRVALARALVYGPEVLLMDEPFSSLDPALRRQMGAEVRALRERLGLSLIFVTHDQQEAFGIADRLGLMNKGRIEQVGTPADLYDSPRTAFVRDFLGKTLTLRGTVTSRDGDGISVELPKAGRILVSSTARGAAEANVGAEVHVSLRAEDVALAEGPTAGNNVVSGTVERLTFAGDRIEAAVSLGENRLSLYLPRSRLLTPGTILFLRFPPDAMSLWLKGETAIVDSRQSE